MGLLNEGDRRINRELERQNNLNYPISKPEREYTKINEWRLRGLLGTNVHVTGVPGQVKECGAKKSTWKNDS